MESTPTTEVSKLSTTGELTIASAARGPSPTLAVRRPLDESRPEIAGRTLRSHSRGGRSSVCAQDPPSQAGSFPLCRRTSSMDRATRPNRPSSEPEMLPDRPFPTSVGMDPSPPPLETISSDTPPSLVPTDTSDEASASFHSTPDFHNQPQAPEYYTGPAQKAKFYSGSHNQELYNRPQYYPGPSKQEKFYNSVPNWIVMANSTNTFKRRLDIYIYWHDQEIIYDFHAQLQGTGSRSEVFRYN